MNRRAPGIVFSLHHAQPDDVAKDLADVLPVGTVIDSDKRSASVMVAGDDETLARPGDSSPRSIRSHPRVSTRNPRHRRTDCVSCAPTTSFRN